MLLPFFKRRGYEGTRNVPVFVSMWVYARLLRDNDDEHGYVVCAVDATENWTKEIHVPASAVIVKKMGRHGSISCTFLRLAPRVDDESTEMY